MTTPAKILKKPDMDLGEMSEEDIQKLAGGVVKRSIKLVLEAGEEQCEGWGEPVGAFLLAAAHIGANHPVIAAAMVGLLDKNGPAGVVGCLVETAKDHESETVRDFLRMLRGELLSGDSDRAAAFKAKAEELEGVLS